MDTGCMPNAQEGKNSQSPSTVKEHDKAIDGSLNADEPGNPLAGPATTAEVPSEKKQSLDTPPPHKLTAPSLTIAPR